MFLHLILKGIWSNKSSNTKSNLSSVTQPSVRYITVNSNKYKLSHLEAPESFLREKKNSEVIWNGYYCPI